MTMNQQSGAIAPGAWPECPTCQTAWVLRRSLLVATGQWEWLFQRDCKHKSQPVMVTAAVKATHAKAQDA